MANRSTERLSTLTLTLYTLLPQVSGSFSSGPRPDADCDLEWVSATRFVAERALRERLLANYGNVQLRTGCWVNGLEHGRADASGAVTGVQTCCSTAFDLCCCTFRQLTAACARVVSVWAGTVPASRNWHRAGLQGPDDTECCRHSIA